MGAVHLIRGDHVGNVSNVMVVLTWIVRNVPNFVREVPEEWVHEVVESLEKQGVPESVISQAIKLAKTHGYDFGDGRIETWFGRMRWIYLPKPLPANGLEPDSLGEAEPMTLERAKKLAAIMESQYDRAVRDDNYEAQAGIIKGFWALIRRLAFAAVAASARGKEKKPAEESRTERRIRAGEQLQLPAAGQTGGGRGASGGNSTGGGQIEDYTNTAEQLRPSAPQVTGDAVNLARTGVSNPTAQDVRTRVVPLRSPQRRGGSRGGRK